MKRLQDSVVTKLLCFQSQMFEVGRKLGVYLSSLIRGGPKFLRHRLKLRLVPDRRLLIEEADVESSLSARLTESLQASLHCLRVARGTPVAVCLFEDKNMVSWLLSTQVLQ